MRHTSVEWSLFVSGMPTTTVFVAFLIGSGMRVRCGARFRCRIAGCAIGAWASVVLDVGFSGELGPQVKEIIGVAR